MTLNLPNIKIGEKVLILGSGGGFDVFCGLPIFFHLMKMQKHLFLANYSLATSNVEEFKAFKNENTVTLPNAPYMKGLGGEVKTRSKNYPEGYLAEWFQKYYKRQQIVWMFFRTGHRSLKLLLMR